MKTVNKLKITPCPVEGTHRTGTLVEMTAGKINQTLGFGPDTLGRDKSCQKYGNWKFELDGVKCAVWDYKNEAKALGWFSTFGPDEALRAIFGGNYKTPEETDAISEEILNKFREGSAIEPPPTRPMQSSADSPAPAAVTPVIGNLRESKERPDYYYLAIRNYLIGTTLFKRMEYRNGPEFKQTVERASLSQEAISQQALENEIVAAMARDYQAAMATGFAMSVRYGTFEPNEAADALLRICSHLMPRGNGGSRSRDGYSHLRGRALNMAIRAIAEDPSAYPGLAAPFYASLL